MKMIKLLFFLGLINTFLFAQQPTANLSIQNASVVGSTFSFEVHIERTNSWHFSGNNTLGGCSFYFDLNSAAMSSPVLSYISPAVASSQPNTVAFNNVGGTDKLAITTGAQNAAGAQNIPESDFHLYTVQLTITDPNTTAQLTWGEIDTAPTNSFNTAIIPTFSGSSDIALPVELSSFSANSVEGVKAQLNWETATEVNNYGFEVERSVVLEDAEFETATWEIVAFIKGHGNSNSNKIYSFTDQNLVGGSKFMYRLKQIDIDGTFEYSDAVEVEVLPSKYELFQNYPNPFNPSTNIKFSLPEDAKIAINIYNILGEKVASVLNQEMKAGYHQVDFNSRSAGYSIASGVYIYTIESKNFSQVKKMILMK